MPDQRNAGSQDLPAPVVHPSARVHPKASLYPGVRVEADAAIGAGAVLQHGTSVGASAHVGENVLIGPDSSVGQNAELNDNAQIGKSVRIGRQATIGESCSIGDSSVIEDEAWINDGTTVGSECRVDTGAIVHGRDDGRSCIGDGSRIGKASSIGAGTSIGEDVDVGHEVWIGDRAFLHDKSEVQGPRERRSARQPGKTEPSRPVRPGRAGLLDRRRRGARGEGRGRLQHPGGPELPAQDGMPHGSGLLDGGRVHAGTQERRRRPLPPEHAGDHRQGLQAAEPGARGRGRQHRSADPHQPRGKGGGRSGGSGRVDDRHPGTLPGTRSRRAGRAHHGPGHRADPTRDGSERRVDPAHRPRRGRER